MPEGQLETPDLIWPVGTVELNRNTWYPGGGKAQAARNVMVRPTVSPLQMAVTNTGVPPIAPGADS